MTGTAPLEYWYSSNKTSRKHGITKKMYQARKNPGDDIWLQAWQPSSVLIAMEHSGKTTFTLNNWYHDSKEKMKCYPFQTERCRWKTWMASAKRLEQTGVWSSITSSWSSILKGLHFKFYIHFIWEISSNVYVMVFLFLDGWPLSWSS